MIEDNYEISLWEDYLFTPVVEGIGVQRISKYYKERKIAVIGSNKMTSTCRALNPVLVENINGTKTFTFKMFYYCREDSYIDAVNQIMVKANNSYDALQDVTGADFITEQIETNSRVYKNPFLNLLVNERKVKVKWKNKWYDFVIKGCQENTGDKSITYTCEDSYINELGKIGFNIELNDDLQNNQGTVTELAEKILENTDWMLENSDTSFIKEKKEDQVYEFTLETSLVAHTSINPHVVTISSNQKILLYYSQIQKLCTQYFDISSIPRRSIAQQHIQENYLQFAYALNSNYEYDASTQLVNNADFYYARVKYEVQYNLEGLPSRFVLYTINDTQLGIINLEEGVSSNYRAEMLIRKQVSVFDNRTGKYCDVFIANENNNEGTVEADDVVYKYTSIQYNDPTVVNNLVNNAKDFVSTSGWIGSNIGFRLFSPATDIYESLLTMSANETYYNNGLTMLSSYIPDGFARGEQYVFRYKARKSNGTNQYYTNLEAPLTLEVREYTYNAAGEIILDSSSPSYFSQILTLDIPEENWCQKIFTCDISATRSNIYENKVGFFISTGASDVWIEEIQFFKYCADSNGTIICPGQMGKDAIASLVYTYYNNTKAPKGIESKDIYKLWESTVDWDYGDLLTPVYNTNFEKIRSINAKQSNCLNLLQNLAEIFECRLEFYVPHEDNGELIYNEDADYNTSTWYGKPQKYLRILPQDGNQIGIGFIYGIDLKSIRRTIKSDQIVTKTIVSPNINEFATDGVCAIERSVENFPRSNFILNFDYYISQGFMDREDLNKDLYSTDAMGYYYWLNKYNSEYDNLTQDLVHKKLELSKKQSFLTVYDSAMSSLNDQIQIVKDELMKILNMTWAQVEEYIAQNYDDPDSLSEPVLTRITAYINYIQMLSNYTQMYDELNTSVIGLINQVDTIQTRQEELLRMVRAKDAIFYRKYSRFLREGCWTGKEYINDDLYYFDAVKNARLSSRPVVTYDVSVMRVSALEEFKNKVFNLGDVTFMQDTEFFGYVIKDGVKTPYKEKIMISEITSYFEEPYKDTFKVQNYKSEFEDLFQRFNSVIQDFQFRGSSYYRR